MKKIIVLLLIPALVFSLTACGGKGTDDKSVSGGNSETETTSAQTTLPEEETEPAEPDDDSLIAADKDLLVGSWNFSGIDAVKLVFNADGTGSYTSFNGKDLTFTYTVTIKHDAYANGEAFLYHVIGIAYDTGETEEITFDFRGDAKDHMVFRNGDNTSGYSGVINYDEWMKVQ